MDDNSTVYVVDDDEVIRSGIQNLAHDMGLEARSFATAEEFILGYTPGESACLLLDVRMPGMSGMELLEKLADEEGFLPTVMVTGHGDIPMATKAMTMGAIDFVEKPFREQTLWAAIKKALASSAAHRDRHTRQTDLKNKLSSLTPRERQVLRLLIAGNPDKQIAIEVGMSRRTIASYRISILEKMAVASTIELATALAKADISL